MSKRLKTEQIQKYFENLEDTSAPITKELLTALKKKTTNPAKTVEDYCSRTKPTSAFTKKGKSPEMLTYMAEVSGAVDKKALETTVKYIVKNKRIIADADVQALIQNLCFDAVTDKIGTAIA